ncbi:MAG: 2TM domain-containing protein [Sediminibacterium sp.]
MLNEQQKDEQLWQTARARVAFRWSFASYFIVNAFLIGIWFVSSGPYSYFWPMWSMLGWGIGIAFQYFNAYHGNKLNSTQKEFEKLKRKEQN